MTVFKNFNTTQIRTLIMILESLETKPNIMRTIERETGFRFGTITPTLNSLEKGGFVTTERSGRVRYCTITKEGKALLVQLQTLVSI